MLNSLPFSLCMPRRHHRSTLFPYTTLFRSHKIGRARLERGYTFAPVARRRRGVARDRKSTRLNSSHGSNSYAVFFLKKKIGCSQRTDSIVVCLIVVMLLQRRDQLMRAIPED